MSEIDKTTKTLLLLSKLPLFIKMLLIIGIFYAADWYVNGMFGLDIVKVLVDVMLFRDIEL